MRDWHCGDWDCVIAAPPELRKRKFPATADVIAKCLAVCFGRVALDSPVAKLITTAALQAAALSAWNLEFPLSFEL